MAEKYTLADARADGKRVFSWTTWLSSIALVAVYAWSITTLDDTAGGSRWLWFLLPLPFFAMAVWQTFRLEKRQDELMRRAGNEAGHITAKFAIVLLYVVALAESAFGTPLMLPAPFGLPPERVDTFFVAFMVLICYVLAGVLRLKHYTPEK